MSQSLGIIIIDKNSTLKVLNVKDYKEEELYKKCGFKKVDGFIKQTEWNSKIDGKKYFVSLFAKNDGKANSENKYDFPPPVDTALFFGSCALVCRIKNSDGTYSLLDFTIDLWNKIYEKLFGGFEDLSSTYLEDEKEEDELANVPSDKKTKQGYLKDGFVVDSDGSEDNEDDYDSDDDDDHVDDKASNALSNEDDDDLLLVEDVGSELSEESYDYEIKL
jgi:hypothetical protein